MVGFQLDHARAAGLETAVPHGDVTLGDPCARLRDHIACWREAQHTMDLVILDGCGFRFDHARHPSIVSGNSFVLPALTHRLVNYKSRDVA